MANGYHGCGGLVWSWTHGCGLVDLWTVVVWLDKNFI
jgi:hypothetical protein